jgi:hypothetical protein
MPALAHAGHDHAPARVGQSLDRAINLAPKVRRLKRKPQRRQGIEFNIKGLERRQGMPRPGETLFIQAPLLSHAKTCKTICRHPGATRPPPPSRNREKTETGKGCHTTASPPREPRRTDLPE